MTRKKIVIVGGGYLGFEIAKALETVADVTLIEAREAFLMTSATIRALVDPALLNRIILPYKNLLKKGRVVRGRATSISETDVTLQDGAKLPADFIIVATGSSYAAPFKPSGDSIEEFRDVSKKISARVAKARSITIVGAGAVGTELAGEIATAQPDTKITLVSSESSLFPAYPARFGHQLKRKLERMGVSIIFDQTVQNLQQTDMPYPGSVTLTDGRTIEADLIFPVIGSKPQTSLLADLPGVSIKASGRVETDKWLRPSSYPNLFIAGDIADTGDGMTIVAITRQTPWLANALKQTLTGVPVESLKPYAPWKKAPLLLPLGPAVGNSWIFATFGNWVTRMMKGKKLFIPKYRKAFGLSEETE